MEKPIEVQTVIGSAVTSTLGIFGLVFHWPQEVMSAILIAAGAWVTAISYFLVKPAVTPVAKVQRIMLKRGSTPISDSEFKSAA